MKLKLDPEVAEVWPCYRLVLERYVTWSDLELMSIDDVDDLIVAVDDWTAAEHAARKR